MSFDRVLPIPPALHNDQIVMPPRQTSNLLEHKIMNVEHPASSSPPILGEAYSHSLPQIHLSSINRAKMAYNNVPASMSPMDPYRNIVPQLSKDLPLRKRSSHSERSSSASPVNPGSSREQQPVAQFCLCQPDPKIPRPRNAFILYRQHHQAAVVAQNPGLANPDISKIIGEQWRKLPQETKDEWKALAEEEKVRHQQQYPEYRYQPRRYGRDGNNRSNGAGVSYTSSGSTVCNKCGGRIMNPPVSPESSLTPNGSSNNGSTSAHPDSLTRSYQHRFKDADVSQGLVRFGSNGEQRPARPRQWDGNRSQSPDSKRRRFNPQFSFKANSQRDMSPEGLYPTPTYTQRPEGSQARGSMLLHPPRPPHGVKESSPHDPSLKLPPLQTSTSTPKVMTPVTPFSQNGSCLETTVMTIPALNKIKLLAKISPPLAPPFRDGALHLQRGPVISVDGSDPALVRNMVEYLECVLRKEGKYIVRTFEGPEIRPRELSSESGQMGDATVDYLNTISAWHRISDEIVHFVRSSSVSQSPVTKPADEEAQSGVSPKTLLPETAGLQIGSPTHSSENDSVTTAASQSTTTSTTPLALVPRYQLTTADAFACSVPINDSYAPLDHWQWMASLWRACVGPDITVYIRECDKDELDRIGGSPVEVRLHDARTVVVRIAAESSRGLEEKTMRRVGFEIEDFLTQ